MSERAPLTLDENPLSPASPNPPPSDRSSTASSAEAPAHLDAALAAATGAELELDGGAAKFMPRDEWITMWLTTHRMAGSIAGLGALETAPDRPGAPDAAGAIYDSAAETPSLHWLIEPQNKWLQRALVIGAFYGPLGRDTIREVKARRARIAPPINRRVASAVAAGALDPELAAARDAQGVH